MLAETSGSNFCLDGCVRAYSNDKRGALGTEELTQINAA
jgi:hypothetical protein